jgi:hypothetical protein
MHSILTTVYNFNAQKLQCYKYQVICYGLRIYGFVVSELYIILPFEVKIKSWTNEGNVLHVLFLFINVRENRRGNHERTIQRQKQHRALDTTQDKDKQNIKQKKTSNMDLPKKSEWTQILAKGKKFQFLIIHPPCYSKRVSSSSF